MESHLLQMRGLKPGRRHLRLASCWSHLLQMRGLKRLAVVIVLSRQGRIFYRCVD